MFRTFALLVCLLPLSVSAGELDGKSLICEPAEFLGDIKIGFSFNNEHAEIHGIVDDGLNLRIDVAKQTKEYTATRTHVQFGQYRLDRKTLKLVLSSIYKSEPLTEQQCELATPSELRVTLEYYLREFQRKADEKREDNKI